MVSLVHSSQTSLTVVAAVTGMHAPIRTRALRTNSPGYGIGDQLTVYDAVHRQFFVSNTFLNEIDVFSAVDEAETAKIPVTRPWGLDVSPFDGNLYVGTLAVSAGNLVGGDIYVIDTSALAITQRYPSSTIGPSGFMAREALALPDGRFALAGEEGVVVWDRSANTLDFGSRGSTDGIANVCYTASYAVGGSFALSADRTRILMADAGNCNYGGITCQICSYDPVAKQATMESIPYPANAIVPTHDGTSIFGVYGSDIGGSFSAIEVFDAKTLQTLGQNTGPFSWYGESPVFVSGVISTDGKTLYVYDLNSGEVGAFDTTTLAQTGWVPGSPNNSVVTGAIDETGLIAGPTSGGVGFLDAMHAQSSQPSYLTGEFPEPATGTLSGSAVLNDPAIASTRQGSSSLTDGATIAQVYIGNTPVQETSFSSAPNQAPTVMATTPPSSLNGVVDTTVMLSDGAVATCMECFSYGPSIIELVSNGATADGGGTGLLVGYGFGNNYGMGGQSASSPDVSITIGGQPATVLAVLDGPDYAINSNELIFAIPPGTAGTAADMTVTTSSGSTTASGTFHYVAPIQNFLLSDTLQQGVYDPRRDLYYFAGKTQIQVLSATNAKWLSPIALRGVSSSTQLISIAESPDGTRLAVADNGGQAIYVLDPDNPAAVVRFPLLPGSQWPTGLAITNAGMVYFTNQSPTYEFLKLDTSSGQVTTIGQARFGAVCSCRVVQSADSSHIYGNVNGYGYWVNPSNDQVTRSYSFEAADNFDFGDLAVSGDGRTLDVDSNFADPSMNFESTPASTDWEWLDPADAASTRHWVTTRVQGEKLNEDGSILFMPLNNGIDLYARNTGRLLYRIQIPVTPASVFDPLVPGKGTNVLAVITANGVSIVDMSSLPIAAEYTKPFFELTHTSSRSLSSNSSDDLAGRVPHREPGEQNSATKTRRFLGPGAARIH